MGLRSGSVKCIWYSVVYICGFGQKVKWRILIGAASINH